MPWGPLLANVPKADHLLLLMRLASEVMEANLLLFKTVIAGDSWGELAVPVIQAHPATAFIFIGSLLTLVFGVLNLIAAELIALCREPAKLDMLQRHPVAEVDAFVFQRVYSVGFRFQGSRLTHHSGSAPAAVCLRGCACVAALTHLCISACAAALANLCLRIYAG